MNSHQDWKTVVFKQKTPEKTINTFQNIPKSIRKLEEDKDEFHHERVSSALKNCIIKARNEKKMTQSNLANAVNEKLQLIQEYERGTAIPSPQVLSKLSRVLGVQLKKDK